MVPKNPKQPQPPSPAPQEEYLRWAAQSQRNEAISDYAKVMKEADAASVAQVKSLTEQVEKSFNTAQSIYKIALAILGVGFMVACALALLPGVADFQRTVGVIGLPVTLVVFLVLIYRSPLYTARKSMADVVKIQSIYLSVLRRINQLDMGFKQAYLSSETFNPDLFEETSSKIQEIIDKALDDINLLMEDLN